MLSYPVVHPLACGRQEPAEAGDRYVRAKQSHEMFASMPNYQEKLQDAGKRQHVELWESDGDGPEEEDLHLQY